jgi:23S rRNA U2552 (ribose-2'-O)-methylase RlmE/FtsJ
MCLGFQHFIHKTKDKMSITEDFVNRKKVYLVTSLFEKTIDKKEKTTNEEPFMSIDIGLQKFIKDVEPESPQILSRAFLKLMEMIVYFDLIPSTSNFVSAHLAEGPGSFIQATILFRDLLAKQKKIKTSSNDKFFAVTLHSDNEHLLMEKNFLNYYNKEKPKRLHIIETVDKQSIKVQKGGARIGEFTDGDITNLHTINIFGGHQKGGGGFSEEADLITADGGFDWKNENLQEQEAYRLIFGQILTALKTQKNNGHFVLKIFETYTKNTIKILELLRLFYSHVYICKPFTSRISNSEKYVVCKNFNKKIFTSAIAKKIEEMISVMNKNSDFNVIEVFSDFVISDNILKLYKNMNIELSLKQYVGMNNIIQFILSDNYNGNEYNNFLDKQILASTFWNNVFLNFDNYPLVNKWVDEHKNVFVIVKQQKEQTIEKKEIAELSRILNTTAPVMQSRSKGIVNKKKSKSKSKKQKGGTNTNTDSDIEHEPTENFVSDTIETNSSDSSSNNNEKYMTKMLDMVDSDLISDEQTEKSTDKKEVIDIIDDNIYVVEELSKINNVKSKKPKKDANKKSKK